MTKECRTCEYFRQSNRFGGGEVQGQCYFNPPVVSESRMNAYFESFFKPVLKPQPPQKGVRSFHIDEFIKQGELEPEDDGPAGYSVRPGVWGHDFCSQWKAKRNADS